MKIKLVEMLQYMRPEGSNTQKNFCLEYLEPVFGKPDTYGNYIHHVGVKPRICFTSHHDTVHKAEGMQKVVVNDNIITVADPKVSSCLGADCTTGIWLMLNMISEGVEGTYVVHAAEEIGCQGSKALVYDNPVWLDHIDAVISFDRYGTKSVITHQMGVRTASDAFAKSFSDALNMPQLVADDGGSYTDSNEYANIISECTNISVGYYSQHTTKETQSLVYAELLLTHLLQADWTKIVAERDPSVYESIYKPYSYKDYRYLESFDHDTSEDLVNLVLDYPDRVADMLANYGFTAEEVMKECNISADYFTNDYIGSRYM